VSVARLAVARVAAPGGFWERRSVSYEDEARRYHAATWEMRERQTGGTSLPWWHIAETLGVSISRLRKIRLAAQRIGLAVKDSGTSRVTWQPPSSSP
jgi:hypothetical protein